MSLAKLTSISTQTLSLLLERQRLQSLGQPTSGLRTQAQQIARNLNQLRSGIIALEQDQLSGRQESKEACRLLRSQFDRMRGMLGEDSVDVEPYVIFKMGSISPDFFADYQLPLTTNLQLLLLRLLLRLLLLILLKSSKGLSRIPTSHLHLQRLIHPQSCNNNKC